MERGILTGQRVTLAAARHRVTVKVDKVQLPEWLKYLFDVGLCEVEVQRTDVESVNQGKSMRVQY